MALMVRSLEEVLKMDPQQRTRYFEKYASYMPNGPHAYAIRVGSHTLSDNDTAQLRRKFDALLYREGRK